MIRMLTQIRHRLKPVWSLLIGAAIGSLWFAALFVGGYVSAKSHMDRDQLETQVAEYLSGSAAVNKYDAIIHGREEAERRLAACKIEIRSTFAVGDTTLVLSDETRKNLLRMKNCDFFEPQLNDYLNLSEYAESALAAGGYGLLLSLLLFWVNTYPHLGWHRLGLAVIPAAGVASGLVIWMGEDTEIMTAIGLTTIIAVLAGVLVLVARDAVEWIRRGFREQGRHEA